MIRFAITICTILVLLLLLPTIREFYLTLMPTIQKYSPPHEVAMWELMPLLLFATILIASLANLIKRKKR